MEGVKLWCVVFFKKEVVVCTNANLAELMVAARGLRAKAILASSPLPSVPPLVRPWHPRRSASGAGLRLRKPVFSSIFCL
jgi:hypothetical protein